MMQSTQKIVSCMLDIGEILLVSGAEINRIEDTITRVGRVYGFVRVDVFTITSSIVLTVHAADGEIVTQTRRIHKTNVDMNRVEKVNCLSREICQKPLDCAALDARIEEIRHSPTYPEWVIMLTYGLIAGAFAVFFGGSWADGAAALLTCMILRLALKAGQTIRMQPIVLTILASAIAGYAGYGLTRLGLGQALDKIMIGNIMLLIPGITMTTSVRDMISGDLISGLLGVSESILRALAIAIGFAVVLMQTGG